jgi:hypothetical protein
MNGNPLQPGNMNTTTRIIIPCKQRRPITYEKELEGAPDEQLQEVRDVSVTYCNSP